MAEENKEPEINQEPENKEPENKEPAEKFLTVEEAQKLAENAVNSFKEQLEKEKAEAEKLAEEERKRKLEEEREKKRKGLIDGIKNDQSLNNLFSQLNPNFEEASLDWLDAGFKVATNTRDQFKKENTARPEGTKATEDSMTIDDYFTKEQQKRRDKLKEMGMIR